MYVQLRFTGDKHPKPDISPIDTAPNGVKPVKNLANHRLTATLAASATWRGYMQVKGGRTVSRAPGKNSAPSGFEKCGPIYIIDCDRPGTKTEIS